MNFHVIITHGSRYDLPASNETILKIFNELFILKINEYLWSKIHVCQCILYLKILDWIKGCNYPDSSMIGKQEKKIIWFKVAIETLWSLSGFSTYGDLQYVNPRDHMSKPQIAF